MTTNIRTLVQTLTLTVAALLGTTGVAFAGEPAADGDEVHAVADRTLEGQVNINSASQPELELLPGVGPSIAQRIIAYRTEHPFGQRNHIMRIRGVGQKTFAKIKDYLSVEGETTLRRR
jgi:competence protein ComEA